MKNISKIVKKNINESWTTPDELKDRLDTYLKNTNDSKEWQLRSIMAEIADGLEEINTLVNFILEDPENATMV